MASLDQAKKRITQQTFDETVRENMEEFEMEAAEALEDAIEQYKSQGVDLTNVDISGIDRSQQRKELAEAIDLISAAAKDWDACDKAACASALATIRDSCMPSNPTCQVNQAMVSMHKGAEAMSMLCDHDEVCIECCQAIISCSNECIEFKDGFTSPGMARLGQMLCHSNGQEKRKDRLVCSAVGALCVKTEGNKSAFTKKAANGMHGLLVIMDAYLEQPNELDATGESAGRVVAAACYALKYLVTFDDMRRDFSGAYDTARNAVEIGFVKRLIRASQLYSTDPATMASIFSGIRALACNDEAVQQISAGGGVQAAVSHLKTHGGHAMLCRQAAALMRNLSGNDDVKTTLCNSEAVELLFIAANTHMSDGNLAEHVVATLGAMALRKPENCDRIVTLGGASVLTQCMRRFPNHVGVQRQSCLAVRNLVARNPHLREVLLEDDMEGLLRQAGKHGLSIDAAYAALRDLKCEVELMSLNENGEVQVGVEQFGQVKSSFKAVWDDTPDVQNAMQGASKSPAELGWNMN